MFHLVALMKEPEETKCLGGKEDFVGTAIGSYIINVIATVSVSLFAFFVSCIYPNHREDLRKALRDRWQELATRMKRFRRQFSRAGAAAAHDHDNHIVNLAIAHMLVDLERGRLHDRITERRQWGSMVLCNGNHLQRLFRAAGAARGQGITEAANLLPLINGSNGNFIVQFNVCLSDHVSTESARDFMHEVLCRRALHRSFEITSEPPILILGSKLISARFNVLPVSEEHAQQFQTQELKDLAEAAMMLDKKATLQIGGLTFIHQDEQGRLTMSILSEMDVPIISSVTNFQGRALMITGCFLSGCEFKASTSNQCTNLRTFKEVKLKDGLQVVFARVPLANEILLDKHTYIYAYKSIFCEAKSFIVRSESELIIKPSDRLRWLTTPGIVLQRSTSFIWIMSTILLVTITFFLFRYIMSLITTSTIALQLDMRDGIVEVATMDVRSNFFQRNWSHFCYKDEKYMPIPFPMHVIDRHSF